MRRLLGLFICSLLVTASADAQRRGKIGEGKDDFINGLVHDVSKAVKDSVDEVAPMVEKNAKSIWNDVQDEVDQGFVRLSSFTNEVSAKVADLEKSLEGALNSEDMVKARAMLQSIDGKSVDAVVDALTEKAMGVLDVSADKIDEVKAVLAKDIKSQGALLDKCLDEGKAGLASFQKDSEKLFSGMESELKSLVSDADMKKLKARFDDTSGKIEKLFAGAKPAR